MTGRTLLAAAFFYAASLHAAGTVSQTPQQLGTGNVYAIQFQWQGDASTGSVPATTAQLPSVVQGYRIISVEVQPGTPAPTNSYTLTLTTGRGVDLLAGGGGGMSSTSATSIAASPSAPPIFGTFTLNITGNSVAGAKGTVLVYLAPLSQVMGLTPTAPSFASQGPNLFLASPNGSSGAPNFRAIVSADLPANLNAATATALQNAPTDCSAGQGATGIDASGNAQGCTTYAPVTADINSSGQVIHGNHITDSSIPNSGLANPSTTVNGITCTLGSTCTVSAGGTSGPFVFPSDYTFTQTPGGSLTGGSLATVNLAPCPKGVNGSDSAHYLYVSAGTGTAEAVLITGGTCTSGAGSGTVTFTPANNHTGSWTISSATAGYQEAANANPSSPLWVAEGTANWYAPFTMPATCPGLYGAGYKANIDLQYTSGNGITAPSSGEVHFQDFWITPAAGAMTAGAIIDSNGADYVFIERVHFGSGTTSQAPYIGYYQHGGSYVFIHDCTIIADMFPLKIVGAGTGGNSPSWLSNLRLISELSNTTYLAGSAAIYLQDDQDIHITDVIQDQGVFDDGIRADTSDGNAINNIFVENSLFQYWGENGINASVSTSGQIFDWHITGSSIFALSGSAATKRDLYMGAAVKGWKIANSALSYTDYGAVLTNALWVTFTGNHIYPTANATTGKGVFVSNNGTTGAHLTLVGNDIGAGPDDGTGSPSAYGFQNQTPNFPDLVIVGNKLWGSTSPLSLLGNETGVIISGNEGVDNTIPAVASAATLAFPINPNFTITGTTGVTAVSGLFAGQRGSFVTTSGAVAFTAGATIGNTCTTTANKPYFFTFDGTKIWISGSGC